jgi:hypothetical protein
MKNKIPVMRACAVAALLSVISCTTIRLSATWKDKNFQNPSFRKVVVIGLCRRLINRQNIENAVVEKLKIHDIQAEPSLDYVQPGRDYKYNEINQYLQDNNVEGILTVGMVRSKHVSAPATTGGFIHADLQTIQESKLIPVARGGGGGGRQSSAGQAGPGGNYLVTMEANLHRVANDQSVWMAELELKTDYLTEDGFTDESDKESAVMSKLIVDALIKDAIIPGRPEK